MGKKSQNPIVAARRAAPSLLLSAEARERRLSGVAVTDGRSSLRPAEGAAARKGARRGAARGVTRRGRRRRRGAAGRGRREARPGDARPGREMSAEAAQAGSCAGTAAPGPGPPPAPRMKLPPVPPPRPAPDGGLFGWLRGRCLGRSAAVDPARDSFRAMTGLYGSIQPADSVYLSTRTHGAVFNLEYSPDGYGPRPSPPPIAAPARCGRPGPGVAGRHPQEGAGAAFRPPRGRAVAELWERPALGASRGGARGAGWERAAPSGGTSGCGGVREGARRAGSARRVGLKREPRLLLSLRGPWGCCRWHSYGAVLLVLSRRRRRRCRLEWRWERRCGPKWSELGSEKRA